VFLFQVRYRSSQEVSEQKTERRAFECANFRRGQLCSNKICPNVKVDKFKSNLSFVNCTFVDRCVIVTNVTKNSAEK
jgi:hypothetical protein